MDYKRAITNALCFLTIILMSMGMSACTKKATSSFVDYGYYKLYSVEADGTLYTRDDLGKIGLAGVYLWLDEDGYGELFILDNYYYLEWEDGKIDFENDKIDYKWNRANLCFDATIDDTDYSFAFRYNKDEGPDYYSRSQAVDYIGLSKELTDAKIEIVGAQYVINHDGNEAMRLYYDFTNKSEDVASARGSVRFEVTQGGVKMSESFIVDSKSEYFADEDERDDTRIYPGVTIRFSKVYAFNPIGGDILVKVLTGYGEEEKSFQFAINPDSLSSDRPEQMVIDRIPNPQFTSSLPQEKSLGTSDGTYAYTLTFKKMKGITNEKGINVVRLYYEVKNIGKESLTARDLGCEIVAFQDGIELGIGWADRIIEEDNVWEDIEPGKKLTIAKCYTLLENSDSPVEVIMSTHQEGVLAGMASGKLFD